MKTFTLTAAVLALCASCVAADKKAAVAAKPAPAAMAAKERQARYRLASDFQRVAGKLTADEVKAVQAIVAKHTAKPATPAKKK